MRRMEPLPDVPQRVRVLRLLHDEQQESEDQREGAALHSLARGGCDATKGARQSSGVRRALQRNGPSNK